MGRTRLAAEIGQFDSSIGTGLLFPDIEKELVWQKLARSGKNVIDAIPGTNIVIDPYSRSDFKKFRHGMTVLDDGSHGWAATETFGEVREAVIADEAQMFDVEVLRSTLQELSHQHLSVLRASVKQEQLVSVISKAEANLNLMDSSLLVTAAVLSVLPKMCRRKEVQVGLSVILVGSLLLAACNEALTQRPPAVKIATGIPTRIYPTKIPEPTFTPISSFPPEIVITPSNGAGGPEFVYGSAVDLQLSVNAEVLSFANCAKFDDKNAFNILMSSLPADADVQGTINELTKFLNKRDGQRIDALCVQPGRGWAIQVVNSQDEILWAEIGGQRLHHPNQMPKGSQITLESVGKPRNSNLVMRMVILNGQPWIVEFIKDTNYPQRYFNPAENVWKDFSWNRLAGSEKLINPNMQIVDIAGDFSILAGVAAKDDGGGGFKVTSGDGLKELSVTVHRPIIVPLIKKSPELLIRLKYGSNIVEFKETSFGIQTDGKDMLEVKFRPGSDEITIVINDKEIKTIPAKGLLAGKKLIPGVLPGRDGKMAVTNLEVKVPNGGNVKDKVNVTLREVIPVTTAPTITARPQSTPVPTFTKTPEPSKGPRLLTQAEGQNLLSNLSVLSECVASGQVIAPYYESQGWKNYYQNIASIDGTRITYKNGESFDVVGAGTVVLKIFPKIYTSGSVEIIHVTSISPKLIIQYLKPNDPLGINVSPSGKVDRLVLTCYYQ